MFLLWCNKTSAYKLVLTHLLHGFQVVKIKTMFLKRISKTEKKNKNITRWKSSGFLVCQLDSASDWRSGGQGQHKEDISDFKAPTEERKQKTVHENKVWLFLLTFFTEKNEHNVRITNFQKDTLKNSTPQAVDKNKMLAEVVNLLL